QVFAVALYAEVGAEVAAAAHDVQAGVVQVGGAGMLEFGVAPARPGQPEVIAGKVIARFGVFAALGAQGLDVEHMHVAHVRLQALGALTRVADGPDAPVDFTQHVFDHGLVHALDLLHFVVLDELLSEAQLFGQLVHDHVVGAAFPQRLDDTLAPLQRAVRRGTGAAGFELRGRRQQINRPVGVEVFGLARHGGHGCGGRRIRVDHHQQVELVHGALHFEAARLRVGRVPPVEHRAQVGGLVDDVGVLEHAIDPARYGDARLGHQVG